MLPASTVLGADVDETVLANHADPKVAEVICQVELAVVGDLDLGTTDRVVRTELVDLHAELGRLLGGELQP